MKTSSPFSAPHVPPVTGASRKSTPRSAHAAATRRASSGDTVLESISVLPARNPPSAPFASLAPKHFFERGRIAHDRDQHVRLRGHFAGIRGELRALANQIFRLRLRAIPDDERKSRLQQIPRPSACPSVPIQSIRPSVSFKPPCNRVRRVSKFQTSENSTRCRNGSIRSARTCTRSPSRKIRCAAAPRVPRCGSVTIV